jgi:hypothetical protein
MLNLLLRFARTAAVVVAIPCVLSCLSAQTLTEKLSQRADYMPAGPQPLDQLIDLAKHYQLPMGIEWIDEPESSASETNLQTPPEDPPQAQLKNNRVTLLQLVRRMVAQIPGYTVSTAYGILLISKPGIAASEKNLLNLKMPAYRVRDADAHEAEFQLRLKIAMTLNPEAYANGYGGGYGDAPDTPLWIKNINIAGQGMTVREILSRIVEQNGHILWLVEFAPSKTNPDDSYFAQGEWPTPEFHWLLIPLS